MASWKKILTALPAMTDLASSGHSTSKYLKGDGSWDSPSTGSNYYLSDITKSGNTLTFVITGGSNVTETFGSNAFTSTTIPTGALASLSAVGAAQITDNSVGAAELDVSGNGTSGYVLASDGDGSFSWAAQTTNTDVNWNGGTGGSFNAATARTSIGGTSVGKKLITLTDPGAVTFLKINADNTVTARSAANFRSDIGAGTSSFDGAYGSLSSVPTSFAPTIGTTSTTAMAGNTVVDNVSVANLKTRLASDMSGAVTIGDSNDTVTIAGNLLVSGETVTMNVDTIKSEDHEIELAVGSGSAAGASGAGIVIDTSHASYKPTLAWKNGNAGQQWQLTHEADGTSIPIALMQIEPTSGAPSGLDDFGGGMAYNSADGTLYYYDAT